MTTVPPPDQDPGPHPPEVLIITGMSGAGRSTAARCLEDLGWFVVDNLPPALLPPLAELAARSQGAVPRVAAVVDIRGLALFADLRVALERLSAEIPTPRILFLETSDAELVRRFESVRRPHPLQGDGTLADGIAAEREILRGLRTDADLVVDTSALNIHQLRAKIDEVFAGASGPGIRVAVLSFGFKYGLPPDADLVLDVRFLPNPHWVPELRALSGLDAPVSEYVLAQPLARPALDRYADLLDLLLDGFTREGKRYLTVAVGCTGGRHRSVAMAVELARDLVERGVATTVVHRDVGRE
ncbi:MAG: RNase adapter RapZ [Actinomycetes bacterium]